MTSRPAFRERTLGRGLRKLRRWCWTALVIVLILAAVAVGAGRLAAPYADQARPWLEHYLSNRLGQPVSMGRIQARWPRLSPQVELLGIRIGEVHAPELEIDRARLDFHLPHLFRPARNTVQLVILGLDLAVVQDADGTWTWQLEAGGRLAPGWESNLIARDLLVREARIRIAGQRFRELDLQIAEADLHREGSQIRARVGAFPAGSEASPVEARLVASLAAGGFDAVSAWVRADDWNPLILLATGPDEQEPEQWHSGLDLWLDWNRVRGARVHADVSLRTAAAAGSDGVTSMFAVIARWQPEDWRLEVSARAEAGAADQDPEMIRSLALGRRDGRLAIAADAADLGFVHRLLIPWIGNLPAFPAALDGRVLDFRLGLNPGLSPYRLAGRIEGLKLGLKRPPLELEGLDLDLGLDGDRAVLALDGAPLVVWPAMLRSPARFDQVAGRVKVSPGLIELDRVEVLHQVFEARADGEIVLGPAGPFLDFSVVTDRLDPGDPRPWLPHGIIPGRVLDWLDQAVERIESGRADLVFHGARSNWPELIQPGSFTAILDFSGLDLDYWPRWPAARNLEGQVEFAGRQMLGRIDSGQVEAVALRAVDASIANLRAATLELDLESVDADAAGLSRLAASFPVDRLAEALAPLEWSGPARATARLRLPFSNPPGWSLEGELALEGVDFRLAGSGLGVDGLHGNARYDRAGFEAGELTGQFAGEPVQLAASGRFAPELFLEIAGELPSAGLIPTDWQAGLNPVRDRLEGRSLWRFLIRREDHDTVLAISSSLEGTALDLPDPLAKHAADALPFLLRVPLGIPDRPYSASLGERIAVEGRADPERWALGLAFGGDRAVLPEDRQLSISGHMDRLDLDGWARLLGVFGLSGAGGAQEFAGQAELGIGALTLAGQELPGIDLSARRDADLWTLEADGPWLSGQLRLDGNIEPRGLALVRIARLHWSRSEREDEPLREPSTIDPRVFPALDLTIEEMRWGELEVGRLTLDARPVDQGLDFSRFESEHGGLGLSATGQWHMTAGGPAVDAEVMLRADDLARTLTDAGYEAALQGGNARIELIGRWPGSPLDFALARVDGKLGIRIDDGSIPEARPGAGRLLGLVTLGAIPRRLRLDFRDVFGAGLSFDRIDGEFELAGGKAQTDRLDIDAPAAQIRLSGTTDLDNRLYDQQLRVQPGLGSTLPIIGALAGGPLGAAAGIALQQILDRPLRGLSEVRYRITGTWDEPVIELVGAEPVPATGNGAEDSHENREDPEDESSQGPGDEAGGDPASG